MQDVVNSRYICGCMLSSAEFCYKPILNREKTKNKYFDDSALITLQDISSAKYACKNILLLNGTEVLGEFIGAAFIVRSSFSIS